MPKPIGQAVYLIIVGLKKAIVSNSSQSWSNIAYRSARQRPSSCRRMTRSWTRTLSAERWARAAPGTYVSIHCAGHRGAVRGEADRVPRDLLLLRPRRRRLHRGRGVPAGHEDLRLGSQGGRAQGGQCDMWCVMCDVWCVMCDVWCVNCDV